MMIIQDDDGIISPSMPEETGRQQTKKAALIPIIENMHHEHQMDMIIHHKVSGRIGPNRIPSP
jgi:hypothetical protein